MAQNRKTTHAAPPPRRRPAPKARRLPRGFGKLCALCILGLLVAFVLQAKFPDGLPFTPAGAKRTEEKTVTDIHGAGPIRLNELMSSNAASVMDENGAHPDWLELINISGKSVDLQGYSLAKDENAANVFTFPKKVLASGECVIVYADATLQEDADKPFHAPFKLSSKGGTLMLFSPSGTVVDSVNFPALSADTVYMRLDKKTWQISDIVTPGNINDQAYALGAAATTQTAGVEITELVAGNTRYAPDDKGVTHDYVELHNASGDVVDLSGWYLSDDPSRPNRYALPDGFTLQPGEYRIVYLSGTASEGETPSASFKLSLEKDSVILYTPHGEEVDRAGYDLLKENEAWSKSADGTWSVQTPTPAQPNP